MKRNLKSLFKRSRSKDSVKTSTPHQEPRPGPAQLLEQRRRQARKSGSDQYGDQDGFSPSSEPSSLQSGNKHTNSRPLEQRHNSANTESTLDNSEDISPSAEASPEVEDYIADDYRAYMSAESSPATPGTRNTFPSSDIGFMSLSGDSRLRTGASEMRHSEDVANRNIDQYGSGSSLHSRNSSFAGQMQQMNHAAQGRQAHRMSIAASIVSLGSPKSVGGSSTSSLQRYTLGTGVPTEGGLIDGILPHNEEKQPPSSDRKNWPVRKPRDESHLHPQRRKPSVTGGDDKSGKVQQEQPGRRNEKKNSGFVDFQQAIREGPDEYKKRVQADLDGIIDLNNTEDTDKETTWAPEVVHETVKPHEHEIIQERIYREIHNHDVYHYVQPVYQTEILPARHWVHNAKGELVEVPADKLPECTGANQRWSIIRGDREKKHDKHVVTSPPPPRVPRIISDKRYITPEGYERRETTILHPPELEDMSNYDGPVLPIEFLHHPVQAAEKTGRGLDGHADDRRFAMDELSEALPELRTSTDGSASSASRPATGSSVSTPRSVKRMSIPRKPIASFE